MKAVTLAIGNFFLIAGVTSFDSINTRSLEMLRHSNRESFSGLIEVLLMNRVRLKVYTTTCVMLFAVLISNAATVHASAITASNATLTTFDAISGGITFEWDLDSEFDITGTDVTLFENDIIGSGRKVVGTVYEFVIPNFYDPLPMKIIEITMHGANWCTSESERPSVLDIIGSDSDFNTGGPSLPVLGSYVSGSTSATLVTEHWEMFPNPDFEIVKLYVPAEFELQSINIATQSTVVPVPASLWLFVSGLLGLVGFSRRTRAC